MMDNFSDLLTLEGAGRRRNDTWSTSMIPLKTWGYNGSNYLCGRSVASKLSAYKPVTFYYRRTRKSVKNRNFLLFSLLLRNEERYWDGP